MKRHLKIALGIAILLGFAISTQGLKAQVYSDFENPTLSGENNDGSKKQYYDIMADPLKTEIAATEFGLPPSFAQDLNDGYAKIPLGFTFEFNGSEYNYVWVCVNGFITFVRSGDYPPFLPANYPNALFINSAGYPKNVVAPFWGDHYYRSAIDNAPLDEDDDHYTMTHIAYVTKTDSEGRYTIIQWKDLNINYVDPGTSLPVTSSVATFQVILHENTDPQTNAGDIEFAYGPAGADLSVSMEQKLISAGAAIGIKGESQDFINGLEYDQLPSIVRSSQQLSGTWQPSNGTDTTILFSANAKLNLENWWGDGDVDLSKYPGNKHAGMPQSRYVNIHDAWTIMRSVATRIPLDSVRRRAAYHGDVNHNGRYFYDHNFDPPLKKVITWQDDDYWENLNHPDWSVSDLNQLYFEVNELDAGIILDYISARVPELPWMDSIPLYGKLVANEDRANDFEFGDALNLGNGLYQVPVFLNGSLNTALGARFDVDCEIVSVNSNANDEQTILTDAGDQRVVIIGTGEFSSEQPVCYVVVRTDNNTVTFSGVRFNDNEKSSRNIKLNEETSFNNSVLTNSPNPFNVETDITVNIVNSGNYTLSVFDVNGNKVANLANGFMNEGPMSFSWDGVNADGNVVANGLYVLRLAGENTYVSKQIIFNK